MSSNPSIDPAEAYPASSRDDERRADFFAGRFDHAAMRMISRKMTAVGCGDLCI